MYVAIATEGGTAYPIGVFETYEMAEEAVHRHREARKEEILWHPKHRIYRFTLNAPDFYVADAVNQAPSVEEVEDTKTKIVGSKKAQFFADRYCSKCDAYLGQEVNDERCWKCGRIIV